MRQTEPETTLAGLRPLDVARLLDPSYLDHADLRELKDRGLVEWNEKQERYDRTEDGEALAASIRDRYGMHFVDDAGGGRWHVDGYGLHAGDSVELMLADGTWARFRFEVQWARKGATDFDARNGRIPVFYKSMAGGGSLVARLDFQPVLARLPGGTAR